MSINMIFSYFSGPTAYYPIINNRLALEVEESMLYLGAGLVSGILIINQPLGSLTGLK